MTAVPITSSISPSKNIIINPYSERLTIADPGVHFNLLATLALVLLTLVIPSIIYLRLCYSHIAPRLQWGRSAHLLFMFCFCYVVGFLGIPREVEVPKWLDLQVTLYAVPCLVIVLFMLLKAPGGAYKYSLIVGSLAVIAQAFQSGLFAFTAGELGGARTARPGVYAVMLVCCRVHCGMALLTAGHNMIERLICNEYISWINGGNDFEVSRQYPSDWVAYPSYFTIVLRMIANRKFCTRHYVLSRVLLSVALFCMSAVLTQYVFEFFTYFKRAYTAFTFLEGFTTIPIRSLLLHINYPTYVMSIDGRTEVFHSRIAGLHSGMLKAGRMGLVLFFMYLLSHMWMSIEKYRNSFSATNYSPSEHVPKNKRERKRLTKSQTCRICVGGNEEGDDDLIIPCKCMGSMRYVHRECLQQWRLHSRMPMRCEVCRYHYEMERDPITIATYARSLWVSIQLWSAHVFFVVLFALDMLMCYLNGVMVCCFFDVYLIGRQEVSKEAQFIQSQGMFTIYFMQVDPHYSFIGLLVLLPIVAALFFHRVFLWKRYQRAEFPQFFVTAEGDGAVVLNESFCHSIAKFAFIGNVVFQAAVSWNGYCLQNNGDSSITHQLTIVMQVVSCAVVTLGALNEARFAIQYNGFRWLPEE